jgi:hypothetical protein
LERKPNVTCVVCGKPFYARPNEIEKGYGKHCSRNCRHGYVVGFNNYPYDKECLNCGKVFTVSSSRQIKKKFCSQSCSAKYSNKQRVGTLYTKSFSFKSRDNSIENGILLCPNHHREADRGLISKEDLLKSVQLYKRGKFVEN